MQRERPLAGWLVGTWVLLVLVLGVLAYHRGPDLAVTPLDLLVWGALIFVSERLAVRMGSDLRVSMLLVPAVGAMVVLPPWAAALFLAASYLPPARASLAKDLFTRASLAGATLIAGSLYHALAAGGWPYAAAALLAATTHWILYLAALNLLLALSLRLPYLPLLWRHLRTLGAGFEVLAVYGVVVTAIYLDPPQVLGRLAPFAVLALYLPTLYVRAYWQLVRRSEESVQRLLELILRAVEARDPYTREHSARVARISEAIARELGYDPDAAGHVRRAAALHDAGKVYVPDAILTAQRPLTEEERARIRQHPQRGLELLRPVRREVGLYLPVIGQHHERWDGRGYPEGRRGRGIHPWARIVAVADAYEAMTADRPYQPARTPEEALETIRAEAGRAYDPEVVAAFERAWRAHDGWRVPGSPVVDPPGRDPLDQVFGHPSRGNSR